MTSINVKPTLESPGVTKSTKSAENVNIFGIIICRFSVGLFISTSFCLSMLSVVTDFRVHSCLSVLVGIWNGKGGKLCVSSVCVLELFLVGDCWFIETCSSSLLFQV